MTSYEKGAAAGHNAVTIKQDYLTAYSLAVGDMFNHQQPMAYLRGFDDTYRVEAGKKEVA